MVTPEGILLALKAQLPLCVASEVFSGSRQHRLQKEPNLIGKWYRSSPSNDDRENLGSPPQRQQGFCNDMAWSNKRFPSVKHRVIVKGKQSRISWGFFRLFPDEMEIEAPPSLVDNEHPRRYRAFQTSKYMGFKREQRGRCENPLDAYATNEEDAHDESS